MAVVGGCCGGGGGMVLVVVVVLVMVVVVVACSASHQHARVSQGRVCPDNCTRCQTEIQVANQTCYLTQMSRNIVKTKI